MKLLITVLQIVNSYNFCKYYYKYYIYNMVNNRKNIINSLVSKNNNLNSKLNILSTELNSKNETIIIN